MRLLSFCPWWDYSSSKVTPFNVSLDPWALVFTRPYVTGHWWTPSHTFPSTSYESKMVKVMTNLEKIAIIFLIEVFFIAATKMKCSREGSFVVLRFKIEIFLSWFIGRRKIKTRLKVQITDFEGFNSIFQLKWVSFKVYFSISNFFAYSNHITWLKIKVFTGTFESYQSIPLHLTYFFKVWNYKCLLDFSIFSFYKKWTVMTMKFYFFPYHIRLLFFLFTLWFSTVNWGILVLTFYNGDKYLNLIGAITKSGY